MEGVAIIEKSVLERLISEIENMRGEIKSIATERDQLTKPLMTVKEVCQYLGKGSTWLDAHKADIGFTKAGGEIRFRRRDVEEYLEQGYFRRKPGPGIKQKIR